METRWAEVLVRALAAWKAPAHMLLLTLLAVVGLATTSSTAVAQSPRCQAINDFASGNYSGSGNRESLSLNPKSISRGEIFKWNVSIDETSENIRTDFK